MNETQDTEAALMTKPAIQAPDISAETLDVIREAIRDTLENAPRGGTDREQQAWRNGVRELAQTLGAFLAGDDAEFEVPVRARPLYEDGLNSDHGSYMDEIVPGCEYCGKPGTRRQAIEHIQNPCSGLRRSQENGERLIRLIQDQTRDPGSF